MWWIYATQVGLVVEDIKRVFFSGNEETTICRNPGRDDVMTEREKSGKKRERKREKRKETKIRAGGVDPVGLVLGDPLLRRGLA